MKNIQGFPCFNKLISKVGGPKKPRVRVLFPEENSEEFYLSSMQSLDLAESKILGDDGIAMSYNEKGGMIMSPFHKSITNFLKIFDLKLSRMVYDGKRDTVIEFYNGGLRRHGYVVVVRYRLEGSLVKILCEEGGEKLEMFVPMFHIDPRIETYFDDGGFSDFDLRNYAKHIKLMPKNNFEESVVKAVKEYASRMCPPNYIR